jgi:hypothetical protein
MPGEHQSLHLQPGHRQPRSRRIEVTIESLTRAMTNYASVLDNTTTDPLAVTAVEARKLAPRAMSCPHGRVEQRCGQLPRRRPHLQPGTTHAVANLIYYPQGGGAPKQIQPIAIAPGTVRAFDNVRPTLFNETNGGGSLVITTNASSSLVTTGRTYTLSKAAAPTTSSSPA